MRKAFVTGGAGFVGSHLVERLLAENWRVTVLDNFDPFYDPAIKRRNLAAFSDSPAFRLIEGDIRDRASLDRARGDYDVVVHLAAKAGVRPSIDDPLTYQEVNVCGTQNLLEMARAIGVKQFVFGSSSSVYGVNPDVPWREDDSVLLPISPYASTKVSGELLGHVYSHLYGIGFVALRFFTVYGPRQRPDLAIHRFARQILSGEPVTIYGDGRTRRDYTFVDDIVSGIRAAMDFSGSPYEVINLGCGNPVSLMDMVEAVEGAVGKRAIRHYREEQPGDVPQTYASIAKARKLLGYEPRIGLTEGVRSFVSWLQSAAPAGVGAAR
ncbi:MAG TPA: NAD-dependent epimerase/dehydratase family protein [Bryobacteraceae bacterium]|jgi:UDP-glucuronate 4-epimerase